MRERRGSRFALEVLFLLVLAGLLALAQIGPLEIGGVMLVGWLIVATLEWTAWREEAHYGSGLPPRYHVPEVDLPPPVQVEQVAAGYPEPHRDEAATWIAPAELRAEVLGEWPHAAPPGSTDEPDPWTVVSLPGTPLDELESPDVEPEPSIDEPSLDVVLAESVQRIARYSLDPLADPPPARRRLRRGEPELSPALEIPARPEGVRALPGRSTSQD
jgi:hypothetical protein